ncbi:MAG: BAX inhibitor protein [Methylophaga sp.]|nr:MAG: BAX inhibitor protein [Methylophaga sp.]
MQLNSTVVRSEESIFQTNKVIKNTYMLLSMTLIFSAITAYLSMAMGISFGMGLVANIVAIVILWFVLPKTANSAMGIPVVFAFTGLLGFGLGPIISHYLAMNPSIVMTAMGGTGAIFIALSGYAITTKKDFSFMGGFLAVGMFVLIGAMILNLFLQIPVLSLALSGGIVLIMSGLILYQTSAIINGGETNYIMATASLFLSILNLFTSLLHILGALSGDD